MGEPTSTPGILMLASRILDDSAALTGLEFAKWGEETCVPSVQATGAVSHTLRYESLGFMRQHRSSGRAAAAGSIHGPRNIDFPYDFLDLYFLPDISSKDSEAFQHLPIIGDPDITADIDASKLLERLMMLTEFDVRFCDAVKAPSSSTASAEPTPFLITLRLQAGRELPAEMAKAGKVIGRYKTRTSSILSALERVEQPSSSHDEVVLLACNSLRNATGPADISGETSLQVGIWGLRMQYTGAEKEPAAWRPSVRI